jgi:flagellar protein FlgJ
MKVAAREIGVREKPGEEDNARIIEYQRATRLDEQALGDDTAWCAAFCSWCLQESGCVNPRYAMARNFLKYGEPVKPEDAQFGDILVFRRGRDSRHAHVCFLVLDLGSDYEVLGGNQASSVRFSHEAKADLLGIRRPVQP